MSVACLMLAVFCRRASDDCKFSAAAAIDRAPLDLSAARICILERENSLLSSRVSRKSASTHSGKEQEWSIRNADDRDAESPAERLARLSAEVAILERDTEEAARQV